MIKTETAFVLGAGASFEYGFPLGWNLVQKICQIAKSEGNSEFADHLSHSGNISIDAFLEHRPDLVESGKSLIAKALIPCEKPAALFQTDGSPGWYRLLFGKMKCGYDQFTDNKVKFITYNYDRSLEHFLTYALAGSYGLKAVKSWNIAQKIEIVHIHGDLGTYAPAPNFGVGARPYSEEMPSRLGEVTERIKVIHEGSEDTKEYIEAREILQWAKRIFFIGFGYNHEALKRLQPHLWANQNKRICGTAYGLTPAERIEVLQRLMGEGPRMPAPLKTYPLDCDRTGKTAFTLGHTWPALDTSDIDAANFIRRIPDLAED